MVNRNNYTKVKSFLDYLCEDAQLKPVSVSRYNTYLKHLLVWADENSLVDAHTIRPSFPSYLATSRLNGSADKLAPATAKKCVQVARRFLTWSKLSYPNEFKGLSQMWIDSLRPPRTPELPPDHEFVTYDEMLKIANMEIDKKEVILRRDRAAACLLFLSGMRAGALVSLPLRALDLETRTVLQWPSLGVRTKMGKLATTYLLEIPEIMEPVEAWDRHVRAQLPDNAMWYTPTVNYWGDQQLSANPPGSSRATALGKRIRKLFAIAQLPHKSPHKFRHGHAVFALQNAQTMADYKAVSMNLMHADISVTDGIYAPLAGEEVKQRIANLTLDPHERPNRSHEFYLDSGDLSREEIACRLMELARRLSS